jgi:hypothetical protein
MGRVVSSLCNLDRAPRRRGQRKKKAHEKRRKNGEERKKKAKGSSNWKLTADIERN